MRRLVADLLLLAGPGDGLRLLREALPSMGRRDPVGGQQLERHAPLELLIQRRSSRKPLATAEIAFPDWPIL